MRSNQLGDEVWVVNRCGLCSRPDELRLGARLFTLAGFLLVALFGFLADPLSCGCIKLDSLVLPSPGAFDAELPGTIGPGRDAVAVQDVPPVEGARLVTLDVKPANAPQVGNDGVVGSETVSDHCRLEVVDDVA
jgi:hypothetical protein